MDAFRNETYFLNGRFHKTITKVKNLKRTRSHQKNSCNAITITNRISVYYNITHALNTPLPKFLKARSQHNTTVSVDRSKHRAVDFSSSIRLGFRYSVREQLRGHRRRRERTTSRDNEEWQV